MPNLLQLAVLAPLADSYAPHVPVPVTKLLLALLGGIGRMLGYKARCPRYSGQQKVTVARSLLTLKDGR